TRPRTARTCRTRSADRSSRPGLQLPGPLPQLADGPQPAELVRVDLLVGALGQLHQDPQPGERVDADLVERRAVVETAPRVLAQHPPRQVRAVRARVLTRPVALGLPRVVGERDIAPGLAEHLRPVQLLTPAVALGDARQRLAADARQ